MFCVCRKMCNHYWIFCNLILHLWCKKTFCPLLRLSGYKALHGKRFLEFVNFSFVSLFDLIDCISYVIPNFLLNNSLSCFYSSAAFSFNLVFTWNFEFMIHPERSRFCNTLWCSCFALEVVPFAQHRKAIHLLKLEQLHLLLVVQSSRIFRNFASGPTTSLVSLFRFSKNIF